MDLQEIRKEIDVIDRGLLELFLKRMDKTRLVAQYKKENNLPILNASREREIVYNMTKDLPDDMAAYTKILYTTLFDLSRSNQSSLLYTNSLLKENIENALENTPKLFPQNCTVACQGIEGAYSQLAADKLFNRANIMYFNNFAGVMTAVEKGLCKYGILPIENSVHGSVGEVYDLMKEHKFYIVKSIKFRINHCLLSKQGVSVSDIKEIYSHEQALGQCSDFLKNHPGVKVTIVENTAVAAKMVSTSDRNNVAAISSNDCANLYGLCVVDDMIQNSDNNYTRFICISKNLEIYPGANKISIMFALPHKPGALYSLISKFSAVGFNLTKLESRPIPGKDFEFMFYIDFESSIYSKETVSLLCEFDNSPEQFVFLGSYCEVL